jgi:phosphatidylglycerol:prolipoprotein diacylglycerol transferase
MLRSPGPIAVQIGPLTLRWYGILMAGAMAIGLWLAQRDARRRGLDPEDLLKAAELALLGGLIGARLYYVAFNLEYYVRVPAKIFAVWEGGLAIHGGVLGGVIAGGGYAWLRQLPVLAYLDIAAPSLALGQAIGRWGNFFNDEAFGTPTALPWKLYVPPDHRPIEYAQAEYFHPTFLYESLWDAGVFCALVWVFRRRLDRAPGALFLAYLGLYSLGRFFTEALRTDALMLGPIRVAQLVSTLGIAAALFGIPLLLKRSPAPPGAGSGLESGDVEAARGDHG